MSAHVAYIESQVTQPVAVLLKNLKASSRFSAAVSSSKAYIEPHCIAIQSEQIRVKGQVREVRRLYCKTSSSGEYIHCGWVLFSDVNACMICNTEFGFVNKGDHCRGCGNIVCDKCSPDRASIYEIPDFGEPEYHRVCVQCFWGQDIVHCIKTLDLNGNTSGKPSAGSDRKPSQSSVAIAEEASKKKAQEEEAYEKALMARINTTVLTRQPLTVNPATPSPSVSTPTTPSADAAPQATTEATAASPKVGAGRLASLKSTMAKAKSNNIVPIAGFVMKTKAKGSGEKYFINVCSHDTVKESSMFHSAKKTIDDKSGGTIPIFDVIVSPATIKAALDDASLAIIQQLGEKIINYLNEQLKLDLDSAFTTPVTKNNYKGDAITSTSIVVLGEEPVKTPSPAPATPTPVMAAVVQQALSKAKFVPSPLFVIKSRDIRTELVIYINLCTTDIVQDQDVLVGPFRSSTAKTGADIFAVVDVVVNVKSLAVAACMDANVGIATLVADVKIREVCKRLIADINSRSGLGDPHELDTLFTLPVIEGSYRNVDGMSKVAEFSTISDYSKLQLKNIKILPVPGLVLRCQKSKKSTDKEKPEEIFVNVCHHDYVVYPGTDKYYMLSTSGEFVPHPETRIPYLTCMVVIHTALMQQTVLDKSGDTRAQVCGDIVRLLNSNYAMQLSFDVSIPLIPGGFFGDPNAIKPIMNLPPADKAFSTDYTGFMYKLGHNVATWKKRLFVLQGRSLKYYESKEKGCKGVIDLKDARIDNCLSIEVGAPNDVFPLKLTSGQDVWNFYCTSASDRLVWKTYLETKVASIRAACTDANGSRILFRKGFMKKEGHMVRNWKKRFFVADMGVLSYYEKEGAGSKVNPPRQPYGEGLKGSISLSGATVTKEEEGRIGVNSNRIYIAGKNGEDLLIETESAISAEAWFKELLAHVDFAEKNPHLVDVDEAQEAPRTTSTNRRSSMFGFR